MPWGDGQPCRCCWLLLLLLFVSLLLYLLLFVFVYCLFCVCCCLLFVSRSQRPMCGYYIFVPSVLLISTGSSDLTKTDRIFPTVLPPPQFQLDETDSCAIPFAPMEVGFSRGWG